MIQHVNRYEGQRSFCVTLTPGTVVACCMHLEICQFPFGVFQHELLVTDTQTVVSFALTVHCVLVRALRSILIGNSQFLRACVIRI